MIFVGIFALLVGILMIGQWTVTILKKQVAGPEAGMAGRGKVEMAYHWAAEFLTAVLLIIAGMGLLSDAGWGRMTFFIADGMLIYTVINSAGYFAQQGQKPMVIMFAVLLVLAVVSLGVVGQVGVENLAK